MQMLESQMATQNTREGPHVSGTSSRIFSGSKRKPALPVQNGVWETCLSLG